MCNLFLGTNYVLIKLKMVSNYEEINNVYMTRQEIGDLLIQVTA